MTPDARKTLLGLVSEYGDSLTRQDGERDLQKLIVSRAEDEFGLLATAFKKAAKAYQKGKVTDLRDETEAQLDLLDVLRGDAAENDPTSNVYEYSNFRKAA